MGSNGCEEGGLVRDATFLSAGHVLARTYVHRNEHGLHVHVHVPKVVYGSTICTFVRVLSYFKVSYCTCNFVHTSCTKVHFLFPEIE